MTREQLIAERDAWRLRHSKELALLQAVLEDPARIGVIPKVKLQHRTYYFGICRNASVARWDADRQVFTYIREKFGSRFPEDIQHPEDDDGFDLFICVCVVEPETQEMVPDNWCGK